MNLRNSIYLILFLLICACSKEYETKPDQSGTFIKFFGGISSEVAYAAEETSDGGFICIGSTSSFGKGDTDIYVCKTDANGNRQWEKPFGGEGRDEGKSVQLTGDGGFVFLAEYTQESGYLDLNLMKTDAAGNIQWSK